MQSNKDLYGFPVSVNLKYFASNYQEKQREAKLKEKELINAAIEKEIFKIKENPWKIFTGNKNVLQTTENKNIQKEFIDNYYVDVLNVDHLLLSKGIRPSGLKFLRLLFHRDTSPANGSKPAIAGRTGALQKCILVFKKITYNIINIINIINEYNAAVFYRLLYMGICFKLRRHILRLIVPLKEVGVLKEITDSVRTVYFLRSVSQYDAIFVTVSLYWNNLNVPLVLFPKYDCGWISISKRCTFISRNSENLRFERSEKGVSELRIKLEELLKTNYSILFCLPEDDEKELNIIIQMLESVVKNSEIPDISLTTVHFNPEVLPKNALDDVSGLHETPNLPFLEKHSKTNLGLVRANFGHSLSLKDMINSYRGKLVQKVVRHLNGEFSNSQTVMSTNLVSFILLYKFRDGVKINDLIKEVGLFKDELQCAGKRIGFTGNSKNVVNHAVHMLSNKIEKMKNSDENVIKPILRFPCILELARLSRVTLGYFVLDAVLMTCLAKLFQSKLDDIFKGGDDLFTFYHADLVEMMEELTEILLIEFDFENSSLPLSNRICNTIFKYIEQEYFMKNEKLLTDEEQWGHRFAKHLESDEEDDIDVGKNRGDSYTVNFDVNGDLYSKIIFYKKSLQPILDSYAIAIHELIDLSEEYIIHQELVKKIFFKLKHNFEVNLLQYPESVSTDCARNSIKLMEKWKILDSYTVDDIKVLFFTKENIDKRSLRDIEDKVKNFL